MDILEVITVDTNLEDELEFLEFVLQNKTVKIISAHHVNLSGPKEVSLDEIRRLRGNANSNECSFLLWNTGIPNPLCWSLYFMNYDREWNPVGHKHPDALTPPKFLDEYLALFTDFKKRPISEQLFVHGKINSELSPVIEFSVPSRTERFMNLEVYFSGMINDIWIIWNAAVGRWDHETRDMTAFFKDDYEQPPEYIEWQESVFDWVRNKWPDWIIPRFTYRLGPETDSASSSAQWLANLLGRNVAGFDPEPPVESPRR